MAKTKPLPDYSADLKKDVTPEQLAKITNAARALRRQQMLLADLQRQATDVQAELERISEKELPELMLQAGMQQMPLGNGYTLSLETLVFNGSLKSEPKDEAERERQAKAFAWLEKYKHGDVIKHTALLSFPREEHAFFKKFMRDLKQRKRPVEAKLRDFVEPQTLKALIKDHQNDPNFPRDLFGVYEKKAAVIIPPKDAK